MLKCPIHTLPGDHLTSPHESRPHQHYTSASFFLIAGVICTLCIVYKGFPEPGLDEKPCAYNAAVTLDTGGGHTNKGYLG